MANQNNSKRTRRALLPPTLSPTLPNSLRFAPVALCPLRLKKILVRRRYAVPTLNLLALRHTGLNAGSLFLVTRGSQRADHSTGHGCWFKVPPVATGTETQVLHRFRVPVSQAGFTGRWRRLVRRTQANPVVGLVRDC